MNYLNELKTNPSNPRRITKEKYAKLKKSILELPEMLELRPIVYDKDNIILGGNMRFLALCELAQEGFVVKPEYFKSAEMLTDEEKRRTFVIKDNIELGDWDDDILANDWSDLPLDDWGIDTDVWKEDIPVTHLNDDFLIPPFSILRAYGGDWLERKRAWKDIIGDFGQARADAVSNPISVKGGEGDVMSFDGDGVSLLDPVLSEVVVKWFGIKGGNTFDCFAGDTIYGFVSAKCGMNFTGIELRQEQVDFNNKACAGLPAKYICDDGQNVLKHVKEESQDLLFSCPPYFDLEVYSELENDASNQASYTEYLKILGKALGDSTKALKQDRFAVIVISNVRKDGAYLDLVGDTIRIMEKNGLKLYNDIILATPLGTAPFRARRYMTTRKVAKVHQNVLVFFKGNMDKINEIYPEIKYATEYKS